MSVLLCVLPHGTTRLPLDRFSLNFILEDFLKIRLNSSYFIKIGKEHWVLYMKTNIQFDHIALISYKNKKRFKQKM